MMIIPGLSAAILFLGSLATANVGGPNTVCEEATTTRELAVCLESELATARAKLNALDGVITDETTAEERELFEIAHKEWGEYVKANCQAASRLYAGGSLKGVVLLECRLRMTRERILEIRDILKPRLDN